MLALTIVWSANANAQGAGYLAAQKGLSEIVKTTANSGDTVEEISLEDIDIDIEVVASVTFINKYGEIVAVLEGDKSVLEDIYRDKISNSYFLSSYGIHDVYLIK
ncbi:MAG TPA: hypothetical protein VK921_07410 [Anditalea sp.]|nr:hypothetical protein [Anditalea sp.]